MPTYRITDPQSGKTVKITGDSPPTEEELNQIFGSINQPAPTPGVSDYALSALYGANQVAPQLLGAPVQIAKDVLNLPIAAYGFLRGEAGKALGEKGYIPPEPITSVPGDPAWMQQKIAELTQKMGAGSPFGRPETETPGQRRARMAGNILGFGLTGQTEGLPGIAKNVLKMTPSATGAVTAQAMFPDQPLAPMLGMMAPGVAKEAFSMIPKGGAKNALSPEAPAPVSKPEAPAQPEQYKQIYKGMIGKKKSVAQQAQADPAIEQAAQEMGIELAPGASSKSVSYKEAVQALKSQPGSNIKALEERSLGQLGEAADNLIKKFGGTVDKAAISTGIKDKALSTIDELQAKSDKLNHHIDSAINEASPINASNSQGYINDTLTKFGGDVNQLNSAEKRLNGLFQGEQPPTYAAINRLRQDIGAQIGKQASAFPDANVGELKQMYKALSQDRNQFIKNVDPKLEQDLLQANSLVARRKVLEDRATTLFGKDLQGELPGKMRTVVNQLVNNGDTGNFNRFMEALPESQRNEIAATALNDIFSSGARKGSAVGGGFVTAGEALNRNQTAKDAFFKYLPPEARIKFDKLHTVAKGIYDSIGRENKSKTARDVLHGMESGGVFRKMIGGAEFIGGKFFGKPIASKAAEIVKGTKRSKLAEDFITSPKFQEAMVKAATDKKSAEQLLKNDPNYNKFLTTLKPDQVSQIMAIGFIPWVTQ